VRWAFLRTTKEPNDDSFSVSPRSRHGPAVKRARNQRSKCESIDPVVGTNIKPLVGGDQGLETVQARHRFFCKSDRVNRRSNVSRGGVTSRTVSPCRAGHGSSVTISKDAEIAR
jgi:hypothetical protein